MGHDLQAGPTIGSKADLTYRLIVTFTANTQDGALFLMAEIADQNRHVNGKRVAALGGFNQSATPVQRTVSLSNFIAMDVHVNPPNLKMPWNTQIQRLQQGLHCRGVKSSRCHKLYCTPGSSGNAEIYVSPAFLNTESQQHLSLPQQAGRYFPAYGQWRKRAVMQGGIPIPQGSGYPGKGDGVLGGNLRPDVRCRNRGDEEKAIEQEKGENYSKNAFFVSIP